MSSTKRIAVNVGGGFVPGLNAVVTGVVRAAGELGWSVVGIRDGFDGLLFPERYPDGGLVPLTDGAGDVLGNATGTNPFCVRHVNAENQVEEIDLSAALIDRAKAGSTVGPQRRLVTSRSGHSARRRMRRPGEVGESASLATCADEEPPILAAQRLRRVCDE